MQLPENCFVRYHPSLTFIFYIELASLNPLSYILNQLSLTILHPVPSILYLSFTVVLTSAFILYAPALIHHP